MDRIGDLRGECGMLTGDGYRTDGGLGIMASAATPSALANLPTIVVRLTSAVEKRQLTSHR